MNKTVTYNRLTVNKNEIKKKEFLSVHTMSWLCCSLYLWVTDTYFLSIKFLKACENFILKIPHIFLKGRKLFIILSRHLQIVIANNIYRMLTQGLALC